MPDSLIFYIYLCLSLMMMHVVKRSTMVIHYLG